MKGNVVAKAALAIAIAGFGLCAQPVMAQSGPPPHRAGMRDGGPGPDGSLEVRALSTRPEAVSGGEALVQITVPRGVAPDRLSVTLRARAAQSASGCGRADDVRPAEVRAEADRPRRLQSIAE